MIVEYDTAKSEGNKAKHGLSLAFGARIFEDPDMVIFETIREGDEEGRFRAVGMVDGKLYTGVHVYRGEAVRFISVRRSNDGE